VTGLGSLTEHDLRRMLDVVQPQDPAVSAATELPDTVLRGLAELIPCSSVTFCLNDPRHIDQPLAMQDYDLREVPPDDEESVALHARAYPDFAPCSQPERVLGPGIASMWQDYFGSREFERTLMAQYYRLGGFRHHLLVLLPATDGLRRKVILWRDEGDIPFSERDRLLLTLLRPHLGTIRDRIEAERHTAPPLTPASSSCCAVSPAATPTGESLATSAYPRQPCASTWRTPTPASRSTAAPKPSRG
jgi:hypothetical protein